MASFKSLPAPRVIQLSINADGTWKVISDLPPGEVETRVELVLTSIRDYVARVAAGESTEDDNDSDDSSAG